MKYRGLADHIPELTGHKLPAGCGLGTPAIADTHQSGWSKEHRNNYLTCFRPMLQCITVKELH